MGKETGARGLRSIIEDVMLDIMFDLPDHGGSTYVINERNVEGTEPVVPLREARHKSA
jgi:ATP-dependent Clp protease ATP-binding subunit ClpX